MNTEELKKLTIITLRKLAKEKHVSLIRTMSKDEIIKAIVKSGKSRAISLTLKKKAAKSIGKVLRKQSTETKRKITYEEKLPEYDNETRLVLMPRDPWWFFAYWVIDKHKYMNKHLLLRVYKKGQLYTNISIGDANSWYVNVPEPGETFKAEIGYVNGSGDFSLIATSNPIRTPNAWPSAIKYKDIGLPVSRNTPFAEAYDSFKHSNPAIIEQITSRKR